MKFKDKQAIYLQISNYICEQILLKNWPSGQRIPSVRELAVLMDVNPNTIMRTYEFLQNKQIIYNKRGIGYSVEDEAEDRIIKFRKERFLEVDLSEFFRDIYLLKIGMDEIRQRYEKFTADTYPIIK